MGLGEEGEVEVELGERVQVGRQRVGEVVVCEEIEVGGEYAAEGG